MPEEVVRVENDKENLAKIDKEKEKVGKSSKKAKTVLNKVVIRRLPPNFTAQEVLDSISPTDFSDFYFVPADLSLGVDATSRAYIEFKNQDDIFLFKDKFDGYVFLDTLKGTEYIAIVEYAPFQGLPKSRARKDKHVGTIEQEQHFQNFLENLKKAQESENQKGEGKLEFSFQIKDDKKVTSTPLLEFIAAAKEEKREAKRKKIEEKKKQREEDKQKKKKEIAKAIPEPIKESKEEIVYDDGVVVRTVPSRLSRNDKNARKDKEKEPNETKTSEKQDKAAIEKERKEKKRLQREKDEKRRIEKADLPPKEEAPKSQPAKREVKRYSELRKARQEKTTTDDVVDAKESNETDKPNEPPSEPSADDDPRWKKIQEARERRDRQKEKYKNEKTSTNQKDDNNSEEVSEKSHAEVSDAKFKRIQEMREKRAREKEERAQKERDERAARQIRNKDRPTMQIYRPKRVTDGKSESANDKSSDEKSENARKRSDSIKSEKRSKDSNRKNSREERRRKGKASGNDDEIGKDLSGVEDKTKSEKSSIDLDDNTGSNEMTEKFEQLAVESTPNEINEPIKNFSNDESCNNDKKSSVTQETAQEVAGNNQA